MQVNRGAYFFTDSPLGSCQEVEFNLLMPVQDGMTACAFCSGTVGRIVSPNQLLPT